MVLARDVPGVDGSVLLPAGTALEHGHIEQLLGAEVAQVAVAVG